MNEPRLRSIKTERVDVAEYARLYKQAARVPVDSVLIRFNQSKGRYSATWEDNLLRKFDGQVPNLLRWMGEQVDAVQEPGGAP